MPSKHPFRFGVVAAQAQSPDQWISMGRRAEELGFSTFLIPDTLGWTFAPVPALTAIATTTKKLRVGSYVFANDQRNPVMLARECATLDWLSGGRFELGLGAGRPNIGPDYAKLGITMDSGGTRVDRLTESLEIIKALLRGETLNHQGKHYTLTGADCFPRPIQTPHPPIMLAATGKRLLRLAAREADIVALGVLPNEPEAAFVEKAAVLREAAGARFDRIELNANLAAAGDQVHPWMMKQFNLSLEQLRAIGSPSILLGSTDEMCAQLEGRRERLGISYITCAAEMMDAMAPVVAALAGH